MPPPSAGTAPSPAAAGWGFFAGSLFPDAPFRRTGGVFDAGGSSAVSGPAAGALPPFCRPTGRTTGRGVEEATTEESASPLSSTAPSPSLRGAKAGVRADVPAIGFSAALPPPGSSPRTGIRVTAGDSGKIFPFIFVPEGSGTSASRGTPFAGRGTSASTGISPCPSGFVAGGRSGWIGGGGGIAGSRETAISSRAAGFASSLDAGSIVSASAGPAAAVSSSASFRSGSAACSARILEKGASPRASGGEPGFTPPRQRPSGSFPGRPAAGEPSLTAGISLIGDGRICIAEGFIVAFLPLQDPVCNCCARRMNRCSYINTGGCDLPIPEARPGGKNFPAGEKAKKSPVRRAGDSERAERRINLFAAGGPCW